MMEKVSTPTRTTMGWVFASCATARSASAARATCNQAAKAQLSGAACRWNRSWLLLGCHESERRKPNEVARHRSRGSSGAERWPQAVDRQAAGPHLRWGGRQHLGRETACRTMQTRPYGFGFAVE